MGAFEIEPGNATTHGTCADCGQQTRTVTGWAYGEQLRHAAYFIRWTDGHLEQGAQLLLSIGRWGEGTSGEHRQAIGLDCRMGSDRPQFRVVDAGCLPWAEESAFLGRMLTRDEALALPICREAFSIADGIVEQDDRLRAFLLGAAAGEA